MQFVGVLNLASNSAALVQFVGVLDRALELTAAFHLPLCNLWVSSMPTLTPNKKRGEAIASPLTFTGVPIFATAEERQQAARQSLK